MDEIEAFVDEGVPKYKFNANHPMKGVSYEKSHNRYHVKHNDIKSRCKDMQTACKKVKEYMISSLANNDDRDEMIIPNKDITKKSFCYKQHNFIIYWYDNQSFFDIQHIISVLNLQQKTSQGKYKKYSENVKHYCWHKNKFGGYILRELIGEKIAYNIIRLSMSNRELSQDFERDVPTILTNLRNIDQPVIVHNKIQKNPTKVNENDVDDTNDLDDDTNDFDADTNDFDADTNDFDVVIEPNTSQKIIDKDTNIESRMAVTKVNDNYALLIRDKDIDDFYVVSELKTSKKIINEGASFESQIAIMKENNNYALLMRNKDIEALEVQNNRIKIQSKADLKMRAKNLAMKAMDLEIEKIQLEKLKIQLTKDK